MITPADKAAEILCGGGVIAYPTEGVFGLGCLPDNDDAILRILKIKQRDPAKGLILIASEPSQLDGWIALPPGVELPDPNPATPITWVVEAAPQATRLLKGDNDGLAVRITSNPVARSVCDATESPIVSTSANLGGQAPAKDQSDLLGQFGPLVDYVVPGDCGPATGPSEIRILTTGEILRPG